MKNRTAYLVADRTIEIKDSEMPSLLEDDLLIEIKHVGICGSDAAFFEDVTLGGALKSCYPVVLGHECAGIVAGIGRRVNGFQIGDKVAVEPGVPCMRCNYCMNGKYNLCDEMNFMACPPWKRAALQKYIAHPAMMCYKLPGNVSTLEGALIEPLAVGMHAATMAEAGPGKSALILGSGCIGLMVLMGCLARGVSTVYVADIYDNRLKKALEIGAAQIINSGRANLRDTVTELTGGKGADIVFEAAGSQKTAEITPYVVKKGGRIVIVGNIHGDVSFDFLSVASKEVDLLGTFRYRNMYPVLIEAISAGRINVRQICTDIYKFNDVQTGFCDAIERKMDVLKAVVKL